MLPSSLITSRRVVVVLLLSALAIAVLPALGLAASSDTDAVEDCRSCEGCEDGRCDESSPFGSGDHCCPSSCHAHSVWAFSAPLVTAPSQRYETMMQYELQRPLQACPRDVYQPPRS
jgi:hypothetical protein